MIYQNREGGGGMILAPMTSALDQSLLQLPESDSEYSLASTAMAGAKITHPLYII